MSAPDRRMPAAGWLQLLDRQRQARSGNFGVANRRLQVLRLDEFEYGNISFGQFLAW